MSKLFSQEFIEVISLSHKIHAELGGSLKRKGQLLRQMPSCIRDASPYLYPVTDNARRARIRSLTNLALPYPVQTASLHLPVRHEKCGTTTQPAILPMHIIAEDIHVLTNPPL